MLTNLQVRLWNSVLLTRIRLSTLPTSQTRPWCLDLSNQNAFSFRSEDLLVHAKHSDTSVLCCQSYQDSTISALLNHVLETFMLKATLYHQHCTCQEIQLTEMSWVLQDNSLIVIRYKWWDATFLAPKFAEWAIQAPATWIVSHSPKIRTHGYCTTFAPERRKAHALSPVIAESEVPLKSNKWWRHEDQSPLCWFCQCSASRIMPRSTQPRLN